MNQYNLYTIGYAGFLEDCLVETLKKYSIGAVIDVRSSPYSMRFEAFNAPNIKVLLTLHNIHYLFFGDTLGARPDDCSLYTDNMVDFNKFAKSEQFLKTCERILSGLEKFNICLLCAEKDPAICHRTVLIARNFKYLYPNINIYHILSNSTLEPQENIDRRLLIEYQLDSYDLIKTPEEQLAEAYCKRAKEIAYKKIFTNEEPKK